MRKESETKREERCMVCGGRAGEKRICDCCRESLALCDIENLLAKKPHGENLRPPAANAFK